MGITLQVLIAHELLLENVPQTSNRENLTAEAIYNTHALTCSVINTLKWLRNNTCRRN